MIKGKKGFWLLLIIFSLVMFFMVVPGKVDYPEVMQEKAGTTLQVTHHGEASDAGHQVPFFIKAMDLGGVGLILMMLPLMVGASVVMAIMWI